MIEREDLHDDYPEWGAGASADRDQRLTELPLERRVSDYIRDLHVLWVAVEDPPGPDSDRAYLESNAIALVSNFENDPIDPRDDHWLGAHSRSRAIRDAGIWNVDHVGETYDPGFFEVLETAVEATTAP